MDSLCSLVAQVPRSQDQWITTTTIMTMTEVEPITLPLAHAQGIIRVKTRW